jgi:hypothetical protein
VVPGAAFQRHTLDVSYPTHRLKLNQEGASVRDGLTNEFVIMFTYQVPIQTLQLSESMRTRACNVSRRSEDSQLLLRWSAMRRIALTLPQANRYECVSRKAELYFQLPKQPFSVHGHNQTSLLVLPTRAFFRIQFDFEFVSFHEDP